MKIISNPQEVCFDHALEFWTGLLACATDRGDALKPEPREQIEAAAPFLRPMAIKAAGPSPRGHVTGLRLAS